MARFLFASTAFPAHVDWGGLLPTAVHLQRDGHEVLWVTGSSLIPLVTSAGVPAQAIPVVDPHRGGPGLESAAIARQQIVDMWRAALRTTPEEAQGWPRGRARAYAVLVRTLVDAWLQIDQVAASVDALVTLIDRWRPAVVVAEPLMLPAALAAEARGVPLASGGHPGRLLRMLPVPELDSTRHAITTALDRLRRRLGAVTTNSVDPNVFVESPDLQLVYFPHDWYGVLGTPASPGAQFVGACRFDDPANPPDLETPGRPLVVLAVASSFQPATDLLQAMFGGVKAVGGVGVIGGAVSARATVQPLPDHIRWEDWVRYEEVLPSAAAIVHHGGLGTTQAAVRAGVPQLVLPGAIDQCLHAEGVERSGAGVMHLGPVTSECVGHLLGYVLSNPSLRVSAQRLRDRFAELGGVPRAAQLLVSLARRS